MKHGIVLTAEQQTEAKAAQAQKRALGLATYKQDWLDEPRWIELASARGVKLSQSHTAPTSGKLIRFARKIGLPDGSWEEAMFGIRHRSIKQAIAYEASISQPGSLQSLRSYEGHLLELSI